MSAVTWHVCSSFDCLIGWLDHWQTMLTGVGAVGAAALSIHYLRRQIAGSERQEEERRTRRLAAARARLPLSLSDTIHYANEAIRLLRQYLDAVPISHDRAVELAREPRPVLPEQAILSFEALIEATDNDEFAATIANMISEMQVLSSRMRGMAEDAAGLNAPNLESYLMNAAKVHGYAASMFQYARRQVDEPPRTLKWDCVVSALNLNDMYHFDYPALHAFIERARARAEAAPAVAENAG